MARKKKTQKLEIAQVNEEASSLLHQEVSRPKNQNQLRKQIPIPDEPRVSAGLVTPVTLPHSDHVLPSMERLDNSQAYQDSAGWSRSVRTDVNRPPSLVEALEEFYEDSHRMVVGKDRVDLLVRSVNAALKEMHHQSVMKENPGVDPAQKTEDVRTETECEMNGAQPAQRRLDMEPKPWVSLFKGSSLPSKGFALNFIAPTVCDGKPIAVLDKHEIQKMNDLWGNAVVMYVVGEKPSIGSILRFIAKEWHQVGKPQIFLHDEGYFVIRFQSKKDKESVLVAGPHMFFGKPMIVKPWTASFNFQEEILRVVPVWIRLPNLPLSCWGGDSLSRIGSLLGDPLYADECTSKQQRISFARILIEVDVTGDLPKSVQIQDPMGNIVKQVVEFEWLPPYCQKCKIVGHDCTQTRVNTTRFRPADVQRKKVVKVWKPKAVQPNVEPQTTDELTANDVIQEDDGENGELSVYDKPFTPIAPVLDEGWRVVSRRRRDIRTPAQTVGLAEVHLNGEELVAGSDGVEFPIDPP